MNIIIIRIIAFLLLFSVCLFFICISYKHMLKKEQKLIAENKKVPEWYGQRQRLIKRYYANFQKHKKMAYALCALFTIALFLVASFT